jgi:hypothetical protein
MMSRVPYLYIISSNGPFPFPLFSSIDHNAAATMLTTSMSTLALPLALNVISTQAFSAPLQDGLQQPPAFRSFQLEARSKSYPSPLITRDPNHTTATLINITNESDMEVESYSTRFPRDLPHTDSMLLKYLWAGKVSSTRI